MSNDLATVNGGWGLKGENMDYKERRCRMICDKIPTTEETKDLKKRLKGIEGLAKCVRFLGSTNISNEIRECIYIEEVGSGYER